MKTIKLLLVMLFTIGIAACGGGGSSAPAVSTLSGVAAVGAPLVNGTVNVTCVAGGLLATTTSSTGAWQVTLSGQILPCAVQVSGGNIGTANGIANTTSYVSIATSPGIVNITPLTDLMVANLAGTATTSTWFSGLSTTPAPLTTITQAQVLATLVKISAALNALPKLSTNNPITTAFTPTAGNVIDDMLTALNTAMINSGVTYTSLLSNASSPNFTPPAASFGTALRTAYLGTVSGGVTNATTKAITSYSLGGVTGTINETNKTIAVTLPSGTAVTSLVATFTTTGSSVTVGATAQTSGSTANNFTTPVSYTVTAADATTANYTVTVATATTAAAVTRVAVGYLHTAVVKSDGGLWTWGINTNGQLGDGTTGMPGVPRLVPKQIGTGYTEISAGASVYHTVALKTDGSLWVWGLNGNGQLGDGTTTQSLVPKQIGTGYSTIAAGETHTLAIKSDGSLWAWGSNYYGQFGDGTNTSSSVPKQIGTGYRAIAAGGYYSLAIKTDGSLWAWGFNAVGQLGDGTDTDSRVPKQIGTGYSAISASPGGYVGHTIAIKTDGSLWAWGDNSHGQLGDGTKTQSLVPKQIGTGYSAIAVSYARSYAIKTDGSLWAWGTNSNGELGDGTYTDSLVPKQIGTGYTAIAAGGYLSLAIKSDGTLWAWGGGVGDGTTDRKLVPTLITMP